MYLFLRRWLKGNRNDRECFGIDRVTLQLFVITGDHKECNCHLYSYYFKLSLQISKEMRLKKPSINDTIVVVIFSLRNSYSGNCDSAELWLLSTDYDRKTHLLFVQELHFHISEPNNFVRDFPWKIKKNYWNSVDFYKFRVSNAGGLYSLSAWTYHNIAAGCLERIWQHRTQNIPFHETQCAIYKIDVYI